MNKTAFLFFLFIPISVFAQEYLTGLEVNTTVEDCNKQRIIRKALSVQAKMHGLPFIDDFSGRAVFPDSTKWTDWDVFINSTMAVDPPTIGVASFDAIDADGKIYRQASTASFGADTLTSIPIKLGYLDTLIIDSNTKLVLTFTDFYFYSNILSSYLPADSLFAKPATQYIPCKDSNFYDTADQLYTRIDTIYRMVNTFTVYDTIKLTASFANDTVITDTIISEVRVSNYDTLLIQSIVSVIDSIIIQDTLTVQRINHVKDSIVLFNQYFYIAVSDTFYYFSNGTYYPFLRDQARRDTITAADSVYLSFFYQPGGLIDPPETRDSLCVDFYCPSLNEWIKVWNIASDSVVLFKQVLLPIRDSRFLQDGFRFRFRNFASLSKDFSVPGARSNVDIWNIDYVRLDKSRNAGDLLFKDIAYCEPLGSVLKKYYRMPYQHFLSDYVNQKNSFLPIVYRNLYSTGRAIRNFEFRDKNYTLLDTASEGDDTDLGGFDKVFLNASLNYSFDDPAYTGDDWVLYYVIAYLKTDGDDINKRNDTLVHEQRFYNYYSYDDATAEAGYGLKGQGTKSGAVANRYEICKTDSLHGIDILFVSSADTTLSSIKFKLTVWNDNKGKPGSIIYQESTDDNTVKYLGLNRFYRYRLDNPFVLNKGVYYFGWVQTKEAFLNVGFDLNRNTSSEVFYNLSDNQWNTTSFTGSLMVRPVVGSKFWADVSVKKVQNANPPSINIYPIPAKNLLHIAVNQPSTLFRFSLFSISGETVAQQLFTEYFELAVGHLAAGLYIARITDDNGLIVNRKVIIHP